MTEFAANLIQQMGSHAPVWGFIVIFVFMAVESSFIPFPSEVIMIPAGFFAARGLLTTGNVWIDCILALIIGTAGSLLGAYVNYFLADWLGRPLLYRYGKYFFLDKKTLERSEEVFREYGEITTFVCRLIPVIRQVISLPAGLAKMEHGKFIFFTVLGAGIWVAILLAVGAYLGHLSADLTILQMVEKGKELISRHYVWIIVFLAVVVAGYSFVHKFVMTAKIGKNDSLH